MKKYCTVREARDILECSMSTVYRLLRLGELRAYQLGRNGQWRIERESIDELMRPNVGADDDWDS